MFFFLTIFFFAVHDFYFTRAIAVELFVLGKKVRGTPRFKLHVDTAKQRKDTYDTKPLRGSARGRLSTHVRRASRRIPATDIFEFLAGHTLASSKRKSHKQTISFSFFSFPSSAAATEQDPCDGQRRATRGPPFVCPASLPGSMSEPLAVAISRVLEPRTVCICCNRVLN